MTIPPQVVDLMIAQIQANGLKVDRPCLEALLKDNDFRNVVVSGSTPTGQMIQNLIKCLRA